MSPPWGPPAAPWQGPQGASLCVSRRAHVPPNQLLVKACDLLVALPRATWAMWGGLGGSELGRLVGGTWAMPAHTVVAI